MSTYKDLTQEAPSSPRERIGGYIILARMADKGRASLHGKTGDYHYDCPLDNMLFGFKGVKGDAVKKQLEAGVSDHDLAHWFDQNGTPKTKEEIAEWGHGLENYRPNDDPEKKEWFAEQCHNIGIDPAKSTLFDMLEADDKFSFKK